MKDLVKVHWKLTFANNILLELAKINYPSMTLVMPRPLKNEKYSSQWQQVSKRWKYKFWVKLNQFNVGKNINNTMLAISKSFKSSHQMHNYHTNTRNVVKLNEYINKLTLPCFSSFCQLFHVSFFYNLFGHRLFCCSVKHFFDWYIKKLLQSRNDWLLI